MKRILVLSCLLVFLSLSYAQEESVTQWSVIDMKEEQQNLTARTTPVKDNNGKEGALLLINIPRLKDVHFEGNVLQDSYADGEYKVYVSDGTKHITLKHANYLPLRIDFSPYSISGVKSSVVYRILISVPQSAVIDKALLAFEITPSDNVSLIVNGQTWQVNKDGIAHIKITGGSATYSVCREGCIPVTDMIRLEKDTILKIHLRSEYGYLKSETMYPNTSVKILGDNNYERNFSSNFELKLKAGIYRVEWKLPEFESYYTTITIEPDQTTIMKTPNRDILKHSKEYFKRREKENRKESRRESRNHFFNNGSFIISCLSLDVSAGTGVGGNVSIVDAQYKYVGLSLLNIGYQSSFLKGPKTWYYAPTIRGFIPVRNDMAIVLSAGAFCPYSLKEKDDSDENQSETGTNKNITVFGTVNVMAEFGLQKYWGKNSCDFFFRYNGDYAIGVRYAINFRF